MNTEFLAHGYEDDDPNNTYMVIYNGLIESQLFDKYEKILIIHLLKCFTDEIDTICIANISLNELTRISQISKSTLRRRLKSLEEKGILIKQENSSPDNGTDANTYKILNYISVWDCKTLKELKRETDKIKKILVSQ